MAVRLFLVASLLLSFSAETCYGVTFSSLQRTLAVAASPTPGEVLRAGEDQMTVTWSYNRTFPAGTDSTYNTVKVKLCYAPASQVDRAWRKTVDNLEKDKTCQFEVTAKPYAAASVDNSVTWTVSKDVPTATYFVRAYVYNSGGVEVAYGQNTTDVFEIQGISGRHASLDIASVCCSAFSVVCLFGFFYVEKRKANLSQQSE